jgi:hypothetical protein
MYMCVTARVSIFHFSAIFRVDFGTVSTVWHCLVITSNSLMSIGRHDSQREFLASCKISTQLELEYN